MRPSTRSRGLKRRRAISGSARRDEAGDDIDELAGHGGRVTLMEITDDGLAILQFGGGCNGCSQVDLTLKEGIEKELLNRFHGELNGVRDVTDHQRGEHSYY